MVNNTAKVVKAPQSLPDLFILEQKELKGAPHPPSSSISLLPKSPFRRSVVVGC